MTTATNADPGSPTPDPEPPYDQLTPLDPDHRTYQRATMRMPAIVLGIAVFLTLGGILASLLVDNGTPTVKTGSITITGGKSVPTTPGAQALKSMVSLGQPPADILTNLAVPKGSVLVGTTNNAAGGGQYDETASFTTGTSDLTAAQLVVFYRDLLPRQGWQVLSVGPPYGGTGTEVLAKRGSGDGFYWEAGLVVPAAPSGRAIPYSLEVFEIPDAD
jgi:hypothetical protein